MTPRNKIFTSLCLFSVSIGLLIQFTVAFTREDADALTIFRLFSFFTIDSNLLLFFYFASLLFVSESSGIGSFFKNFSVSTAILSYLTFVFIIYHLLLVNSWNPTGWQLIAAEIFHKINPVLMLFFWIYGVEKEKKSYNTVLYWLIFPLVYLIYVIILANMGFNIPYPFFDLSKVSFIQVLITVLIFMVLFSIIGIFYLWIGKRYTNSSKNINQNAH
jgi:hypothetical protein